MKMFQRFILLYVILAGILTVAFNWQAQTPSLAQNPQSTALATREEAYRANNLGVALLEQFKHKEAAEAFRRALQLNPKLAIARINLSIALYNVPELKGARREAESAIALNLGAPQPHYILGLIAKTENRPEDAIAAFQRVLKIDPHDVGANINLGQLYAQQRKYAEAIAAFRTAMAAEPYNSTAIYNLGTALMRSGERKEGQRMIQRFQELRQRGSGTTIGQNYLEQGRYAEAIVSTGAEPDLVERATPAVTFTDATASMLPAVTPETEAGAMSSASSPVIGRRLDTGDLTDAVKRGLAAALGGSITLFDYDGDGDLDLFRATTAEQRLLRNDGGKFTDVTSQSGALGAKVSGVGTGAVAGDYDNDGKPDLFVIRDNGVALYHNDGGGKFSDVTSAAGMPAYPYLSASLAFVDVDHDGDLDIFIAGLADLSKTPSGKESGSIVFPDDFAGAPNVLLRNDGNGKFTDLTAGAKIGAPGHALAVVPTDYNNTRDVDLLIINYDAAPALYSNQRDGSFRDVAREVGLDVAGRWTSAAAGDINKDSYTDFFFGRNDGPGLFAISDGKVRERFQNVYIPRR